MIFFKEILAIFKAFTALYKTLWQKQNLKIAKT